MSAGPGVTVHPGRRSLLPDAFGDQLLNCQTQKQALDLLRTVPLDAETRDGVPLGYLCAAKPCALRAALALGVNLNRPRKDGRLPVHRVCSYYGDAAAEMLLLIADNGIDVGPRDRNGQTPLFDAIRSAVINPHSGMKVVRILLDLGVRCDEPDRAGETPIRLARRLGVTPAIALFRKIAFTALSA